MAPWPLLATPMLVYSERSIESEYKLNWTEYVYSLKNITNYEFHDCIYL